MAIDGQLLFEGKCDQFTTQANSPRFQRDYLKALKCVAIDLAIILNEDTITVGDIEDELSYDASVQPALEAGLDYWLIRFGNKSGTLDYNMALQLFNVAKRDLRTYLDLEDQRGLADGEGQIGLTE